jgi:ribosomal protein S8
MQRTLLRSSHEFLLSFTAAYNANRASVVVRATRPAQQLLALLENYGLVHSYGTPTTPLEQRLAPGVGRRRRSGYLLVWFSPQAQSRSSTTGDPPFGLQGRSPHLPLGRPTLKLTLLRRPSSRSRSYQSSQQLHHRRSPNALQLLATTQGILSSEEARQRRLGGQPLALLEL